MPNFVGLDVGLHSTSVCVIDKHGEIVREGKVETSPEAIRDFLKGLSMRDGLVGLEACSVSDWLAPALIARRLRVVCIEARHAHGILKNNINKTDGNDARGIAAIIRMGVYRAVHLKGPSSQHMRALLTARRQLLTKATDLENAILGMVRTFGLKMAKTTSERFDARVRAHLRPHAEFAAIMEPLLGARLAMREQFDRTDQRLRQAAATDPICRRLMTVPGVGPVTAVTFRSVIDDPRRFERSRSVGAYVGLTPRTSQSGVRDVRGRISRRGDTALRSALFVAARAVLHPRTRMTPLKAWGAQIAERRGALKAAVAVARKLAVIMLRMWIDETEYRIGAAVA